MLSRCEIVIVGAGPSGLAVGACLARLGLHALILERGETLAWSWERHYESLQLHTPRGISSLPGLRLSTGRYPTRTELLAYLRDYARLAELQIECGREVTAIASENGLWRIETNSGPLHARHVVVASGFRAEPREPDWPNQEKFGGRWLRPAEVRAGAEWCGRRVLVVGLGNTATDMLELLNRCGARTAVTVRGPVWIVPLEMLGVSSFRWKYWIPERLLALSRLGKNGARLAEWIGGSFWWWIQERHYGDLRDLGISFKTPKEMMRFQEAGGVPVVAGPWVELLRSGEVTIFPGIAEFTTDGVIFVDGRRERFSDVVVATGFTDRRFPLAGDLQSFPNDGAIPGRPGLWLCGARPGLQYIGPAARRVSRAIAEEIGRGGMHSERRN